MNFVVALYAAVLFFILSPNVLLRLPRKGSTRVVAAVHAIVFGLLLFFTGRFVSQLSMMMNVNTMPSTKENIGESCNAQMPCVSGENCVDGVCAQL
jgi:hypothetical protein